MGAAFGDHSLAQASGPDAVWEQTEARRGGARKGDLMVFVDDDHGPFVAVVLAHERGAYTAAAVLRGKARRIRVQPDRPAARRHAGHVVNSFLRARRKTDGASTRHLAGARLLGVRRYGR